MAKPRQIHNRPNIPEGPGDGVAETRGEREETGTRGGGGEGKESATNDAPPSPAEEPADKERAMRQEKERRIQQRKIWQRRENSARHAGEVGGGAYLATG